MLVSNELAEKLNREFGEGNWKLRAVSRNGKHERPILTLSRELIKLGIKPGDYLVVAIKDESIVIRKI